VPRLLPLTDSSTRPRPVATAALAAACALAFAVQCALSASAEEDLVSGWGLTPMFLVHDPTLHEALTLVTSLFLHGSLAQLLVNLAVLGVAGGTCERALGAVGFLAFFLACGVVAGLAAAATDPGNMFPLVGASGAVAGALGLSLLVRSRRPVKAS
jgi:membrane associated rhomboid family serine protease